VLAVSLIVMAASPAPEGSWFPVSGRGAFTAFVGPNAPLVLGADLEALATFGRPSPAGAPETWHGFVLGVGVRGFFGASPWTFCDFCLSRQSFGPLVRASYVRSSRLKPWTVPDLGLWVQASPLVVRENLPEAPLTSGGTRLAFGVRVDLGVTLVAWTMEIFKLVGIIFEEGSSEVGAVTLPLFALAFVNHLGVSWEYSGQAVSPAAHRFGFSLGSSF